MSNIRKLTRIADGRGSGIYNLFDKLQKGQINIGKTHKNCYRAQRTEKQK